MSNNPPYHNKRGPQPITARGGLQQLFESQTRSCWANDLSGAKFHMPRIICIPPHIFWGRSSFLRSLLPPKVELDGLCLRALARDFEMLLERAHTYVSCATYMFNFRACIFWGKTWSILLHSSLKDCNSSMLNHIKQTPNGTRPHALRTTLHEYQYMKVCDGAFMEFHAFSFESSCKSFWELIGMKFG